MFKKIDHIIVSIICFFLGIFLVSQAISGREYARVIQPENNATLVLEVAKLTKSNADLRLEVKKLTANYNVYQNSTSSSKDLYDQYQADSLKLDLVNGLLSNEGQGVKITIDGRLSQAQVVDLVNAIKNIGSSQIEVNNVRLVISTSLGQFANLQRYEILVVGNSQLLKSSMERKGGIVEQIMTKDLKITIESKDSIKLPQAEPIHFIYAKPIAK